MILRVEEDKFEGKGVKYELLAKDNPEGLILGEKTNCCQTINDNGKSCMIYGATKPNSGFVKFTLNGQIIGQSWVWYNELKNVVCLDNIEIPTIWLNRFKKREDLTKTFQQCLIRLANGFINEMEKITNMKYHGTFFDSDIDDWDRNTSVFNDKIMGRNKILD